MNQTRRKRPQGPSRKRNPRQGQNMSQAVISHPPPIQEYAVRHSTALRFVTNAAFQASITFQNLLDTMLIAVTAVLGYDQFIAVKVRAVEMWCENVAATPATCSLQFAGITAGAVGDQRLHTDTSMGVQPAHVRAKPNPRSLAADFQLSSAAVAFDLECPSGTVVDVHLTFVQSTLTQTQAAQNALVAAAVGAPYWRGLDGLSIATTKFTPVTVVATI
jgi:hypothetical protein